MPKITWTEDKVETLRKYHKLNLGNKEIAEAMGIKSTAAVNNARHRFCILKKEVPKPPIKWTREIVQEWRDLLKLRDEKGRPIWNHDSIAKKYNATPQVIGRKFDEYQI